MNKRIFPGLALGAAALLALTACGGGKSGGNPLQQGGGASAGGGTVTVGSANFPEAVLLGEIYAQALEAKGIKVTRKLNIGSRELLVPQVQSGAITVEPDFNGNLLGYLDKAATATSTDDVNAALKAKLPASLEILDSAKAEDKDSVNVTQQTAAKYHLTSIADLASAAGTLTIGGPPEFKTRQQGIVGLKAVYGLTFKQFTSLDTGGPITVAALKQGSVQAADLFTTDPSIAANHFVTLTDPKNLFSSQNVTPLAYKAGLSAAGTAALNAVSAKLDTPTLAALDKKVITDKDDAADVAKDWLASAGLNK